MGLLEELSVHFWFCHSLSDFDKLKGQIRSFLSGYNLSKQFVILTFKLPVGTDGLYYLHLTDKETKTEEELDASFLILKSSLSTQLWVPKNFIQSHNENTWKSWFINKNVDHEKWKAASMKIYKTQGEQATIWLR